VIGPQAGALPATLQVALFNWTPGLIQPDGWHPLNIPEVNAISTLVGISVPVTLLWCTGAALVWVRQGFTGPQEKTVITVEYGKSI
jgi:hypothetical protein